MRAAKMTTAVLLSTSLLALAGCTGTATSPTTTAESASSPSPSATPVPTIPVASAFGPAAWGVILPKSSAQHRPVVTANRVVFLDGANVRAVDAQGKDAWRTPFAGFDVESRVVGDPGYPGYPVLRLASPDVVAVVDAGKAKGSGLQEDTYATKVTLVRVDSGAVTKTVTLPGTASNGPELSKIGLAFVLPNRSGVSAVLPDGEVMSVPPTSNATVQAYQIGGGLTVESNGGVTIGNNVIGTWRGTKRTGGGLPYGGFVGQGWDSVSAAPGKALSSATPEASDADRLLVGRWVAPGNSPVVQVQVLDASSGKVLSKPDCESFDPRETLVASPNRSHFVMGPLRLDTSGRAECIGGGAGQKRVDLTAVSDDGRAFGGGGDGLVGVTLDGSAKIVPLPAGATPPIGIMSGNVAVHWDANKAILTGNPIQ